MKPEDPSTEEACRDVPAPADHLPSAREGFSSRLPWRYAGPGRLRLPAEKPGSRSRNGGRRGLDVDDHIRHAIREESAATLGRAGTVLEEAVTALMEFDRDFHRGHDPSRDPSNDPSHAPDQDGGPLPDGGGDSMRDPCPTGFAAGLPDRHTLLIAAAAALWQYVVQREAMGLTRHDSVNQVYGVTPELWSLMGSAEVVRFKGGQ